MNMTFTKDGGRGGKAFIRNKGIDQTTGQAESIKDCIYGTVTRWPWPRPPGFDYLDGGNPRLAIHMRWDKR
jgi:hypothetical protein